MADAAVHPVPEASESAATEGPRKFSLNFGPQHPAALGVLRILLEKDLELDLVKVLALAADAQPVSRPAAAD